jgi:molybdenum cofactor cytidylyltransferase
MPPPNCFAVIPAAGQSRRMGAQHKLLLPWNDTTVIDQVLQAWTESSAGRVIVVVRADDLELQRVCQCWPNVDLVVPEHDPPDMKRSIQIGLQHIASQCEPNDVDRWIVAPADLPTLTAELINQVIEAGRESGSIVAPRFGDRSGHPVSFPWSMTPDVFNLESDQGIDQIIRNHPVQWLELPSEEHPEDIDTPADYSRLSSRRESS